MRLSALGLRVRSGLSAQLTVCWICVTMLPEAVERLVDVVPEVVD